MSHALCHPPLILIIIIMIIIVLLLLIIIIITVVVIIINNITKITVWKISKLSPRREFTFADNNKISEL